MNEDLSVQASVQSLNENIDFEGCDDSVAYVTSERHQMVDVDMSTTKKPTNGKHCFIFISFTNIILK